jgi:phage shock protein A
VTEDIRAALARAAAAVARDRIREARHELAQATARVSRLTDEIIDLSVQAERWEWEAVRLSEVTR